MCERTSTLRTPFTGNMNSKIAVYLPSNGGVSRKPTYVIKFRIPTNYIIGMIGEKLLQ